MSFCLPATLVHVLCARATADECTFTAHSASGFRST